MKTTVEFYIRGESKQYKTFNSFTEAQIFMQGLEINPNCEAYGIIKR